MRVTLIFAMVLLAGCSLRRQPPSAIVRKAESCGVGDVKAASTEAMSDWFGRHRGCAVSVDALCKPIRNRARRYGPTRPRAACV